MDQSALELTQAELEDHVLAGTHWELTGEQDPRLADTCAALHSSGRTNFLDCVDHLAFREMTSWRRWEAYALVAKVLPKLDAQVDAMLAFVTRLIALGGEANSYEPRIAFEKWCAAHGGRSAAVVEMAERGLEMAIANLGLALSASGHHDEARRLARTYDDVRRFEALTALARIAHATESDRIETLGLLEDLSKDVANDDQLGAIIVRVLTDSIAQPGQPLGPAAQTLLSSVITNGGEQTLHQAGMTFMVGADELLTPPIVTLLLSAFERVPQTNAGTLERIDAGLRRLVERGRAAQALAFITTMAGRDEDPFALSVFDSTLRSMALGAGEQLHRAVLQWLKVGQPQICFQLSGLLQELQSGDAPWTVDMKATGFSDQEVYFTCRRAIGYFLAEEVVAASLVIAAIRAAEPDLADALTRLLVDPLLLNYGGKLRRYLEAIAPDDPASPYVVEALRQADAYRESLEGEMPAEFAVSSERRQQAHYLRADEMRTTSKAAKTKSVVADLVTHQYILYGNRTSSWIKNRDGSRCWMDSQMASHGFSYEIPRQDVLDPVGLQHRLYELRFGKPRQ